MITRQNERLTIEQCKKHLVGIALSDMDIEHLRDALYLISSEIVRDCIFRKPPANAGKEVQP